VEHDARGNEADYYAAYNTWNQTIHWYRWGQMLKGSPYGIYGVTVLYIEHIQPTATLTSLPTATFTPSLTFTLTGTLLPTFTPSLTSTPAVIHPTETLTPTPASIPSKADERWRSIFLIVCGLVFSGSLALLFIRLAMKKKGQK
jgi:hypothetical protein